MRTLVFLALLAACGDSNPAKKDAAVTPMDAGPDSAPDASCFDHPSDTNYEIINACTTAQKIYKDSHPALLGSDGTLPPLP